jgi:hypothetical protein
LKPCDSPPRHEARDDAKNRRGSCSPRAHACAGAEVGWRAEAGAPGSAAGPGPCSRGGPGRIPPTAPYGHARARDDRLPAPLNKKETRGLLRLPSWGVDRPTLARTRTTRKRRRQRAAEPDAQPRTVTNAGLPGRAAAADSAQTSDSGNWFTKADVCRLRECAECSLRVLGACAAPTRYWPEPSLS